jgi:hypothetical protein
MLKAKPLPEKPLAERIEELQAEIDAFIDSRVEQEAKNCVGVPKLVLRNILTARSNGCQCQAYLDLEQQG